MASVGSAWCSKGGNLGTCGCTGAGERRGEALQGVVEQEQALDPATLVFLRHALPLLPLLVLGLAMGEGSEMVRP